MDKETLMEPEIRLELLRQVRQAAARGDIPGGLRLMEKAGANLADGRDQIAGQFRCLEADLWFHSGDYRKSLTAARLASSLLAPFGESEDLARAYFISGKALVSLGNYREAETAFLDALSLFRRCDLIEGQTDAANQLARVCFIRADYKAALKHLIEAVHLADSRNDRHRLAYLWGNIGRVYTLIGSFSKAAEALRLNAEISGELGDDKERAKALLSMGYLEMQSARLEKAAALFDEAYPLLIAQGLRREQVILQTYLGELNLKRGSRADARRLLNEALEAARRLAPESSLTVGPLRHLAALELAEGNRAAAARLANQVLALAEKIDEPVEKGAALRILAQVALAEKGAEKAEALFGQAVELFDEIGARFEKAETLILMAESALGTPHHVMANLFRAAEIFRRLDVTGRLDKVRDMINHAAASLVEPEKCPCRADPESRIVTANTRLKKIMHDLACAARSDIPVLLMGETGTGKDLLARHYHDLTGRTGEFVAVNCAAFPDTLLEAELFGYRKGAFTGADSDKEGLLQRANGGTFFFDEIGEMTPASQAKLLTVIETCRARPLGGTIEQKLDIRIVAATNCDLAAQVEQGTFRRDLYYRLTGITFVIPPLSERPEDIPLLLHYFLCREGALDEGDPVDPFLAAEFVSRSWPGNVRQLESEVKKLVLFSAMARQENLGDMAGILIPDESDRMTKSLFNQVEQFERSLILRALRHSGGNKSEAARTLAIHESTLRAKMKRYALDIGLAS